MIAQVLSNIIGSWARQVWMAFKERIKQELECRRRRGLVEDQDAGADVLAKYGQTCPYIRKCKRKSKCSNI